MTIWETFVFLNTRDKDKGSLVEAMVAAHNHMGTGHSVWTCDNLNSQQCLQDRFCFHLGALGMGLCILGQHSMVNTYHGVKTIAQ